MNEQKQADPELSRIRENTGFEAAEEEAPEEAGKKETPAEEAKEAPKKKAEPEEEEKDSDDADDSEEDEADDDNDKAPKARAVPYKPTKAERTLFKQFKSFKDEVLNALKEIKQPVAVKKEDEIDEAFLKTLSEETEVAPNVLKKILLASKQINKLDLPQEIKDKLKLIDEIKKDQEKKETTDDKLKIEKQYFNDEWSKLLPDLKKQYKNLPDLVVSEAKKLMDELSHTKEFHKYPLDYILFKNSKKFTTILKVAEKQRAAESSKEVDNQTEEESDEPIDIENMTPARMKALESKRIGGQMKDYELQNPVSS